MKDKEEDDATTNSATLDGYLVIILKILKVPQ